MSDEITLQMNSLLNAIERELKDIHGKEMAVVLMTAQMEGNNETHFLSNVKRASFLPWMQAMTEKIEEKEGELTNEFAKESD